MWARVRTGKQQDVVCDDFVVIVCLLLICHVSLPSSCSFPAQKPGATSDAPQHPYRATILPPFQRQAQGSEGVEEEAHKLQCLVQRPRLGTNLDPVDSDLGTPAPAATSVMTCSCFQLPESAPF